MESNGGNVKHCFRAVEPRVLFSTRIILPSIHKDAVSSIQQSMVVYKYVCRCDCRYVSRTSLRLEERIINMFQILSQESNNQQKFYHSEYVKSDLQQLISNAFPPLGLWGNKKKTFLIALFK